MNRKISVVIMFSVLSLMARTSFAGALGIPLD